MLAVALITASCGGDDAEPANDSANAGSGTAPTPTDIATTDIATTDIATTDIATTDIATTAPAESVSPTVAGGSSDRPGPMALCAAPAAPQVIAFDRSDGAVRWVACGEASGFRYLEQVTDGIVYLLHVEQPDPNRYSAFDSASGRLLDDDAPAPPPPVGPTGEPGLPLTTVVDGITISGAQEGPTSAHDANGDELWTKPGRWVYDDVAAIDDGAVMALEITEQGPAQLVAYEIETGATRWAVSEEADSSPFALSPWVADGGQVVAGWSNVHVHDGADGALVWRTDWPTSVGGAPALAHLAGVAVDDESVYIGVVTELGAGD